jgi:signal transduction histidine kinase
MVRGDAGAQLRPPLAYRITARQWLAIDVVTAVAAAAVLIFGLRLLRSPHVNVSPAPDPLLAAAAALPIAVRRTWPLPALVVVVTAVSALTADGRASIALDLLLGLASYMTAARLSRRVAVCALVAAEAAIGAGLLTAAVAAHTQQVEVQGMLAVAAFWFAGDAVRERRRYRAALAEQEEQRRQAEAARARQGVQEERLRIARELHDILAHTLSVVAVQAGVGRRVGATRPAEALRALRAVEQSSRGALEELRRILCLMRGDEDPRGTVLAPAPGLADLDDLAAMVRSAGTPVTLTVTGDAAGVPPAASLTAYRIVQEALTNVVRHAPGAAATVHVAIGADGLRLRVRDSGPAGDAGVTRGALPADPAAGPAGPAGQHGIVGMRERAAAFGGTLTVGVPPGGGFEVAAFLPVPGVGKAA